MATSKSTLPLSETPALVYNNQNENIQDLLQSIKEQGIETSSDAAQRFSKSRTKHSHALPWHTPSIVAYPKTTEHVSDIVKACHARNIAVTSFGGGTSLGGALSATRQGICVDFKYMDNITELHEDDMDVVVQPNVGWVELNEYLEPRGLFFPPDPAKGARIGGMVSLNVSSWYMMGEGTDSDRLQCLVLERTHTDTAR
jgi:D-lactate dehydrogenase (cytochrome)